MAMKKYLPLLLYLLFCAIIFLMILASTGCRTQNVIVTEQCDTVATRESVINKLGGWYEPTITGVGRRFVIGFSESEMTNDSCYRMRTTDGWIMAIKYNRITWTQ